MRCRSDGRFVQVCAYAGGYRALIACIHRAATMTSDRPLDISRMPTEWLKLMLEEIARKEEEAKRASEEERRRREDSAAAAGSSIPPREPARKTAAG